MLWGMWVSVCEVLRAETEVCPEQGCHLSPVWSPRGRDPAVLCAGGIGERHSPFFPLPWRGAQPLRVWSEGHRVPVPTPPPVSPPWALHGPSIPALPSPSQSLALAHLRTLTHIQAHTHSLTLTSPHTHNLSHMVTHTTSQLIGSYTHSDSLPYTHTLTRTHTLSHAHVYSHSPTLTHCLTHTPCFREDQVAGHSRVPTLSSASRPPSPEVCSHHTGTCQPPLSITPRRVAQPGGWLVLVFRMLRGCCYLVTEPQL